MSLFGGDLFIGGGVGLFGTAATSVTDFAGLSALAGRPDGYTVAVTAESGLGTDTLVQWSSSGSKWLLIRTSCTYATHSAAEWGATAGRWYSSGGITVDTAAGAWVYDTTYDRPWRWDAANSQMVPPEVYDGTIAGLQSIKGDSASPAGWTVTDTDAGGTASITTDGTRVTMSATTSGAGTTLAVLSVVDSSLDTTGMAYMRGMFQVAALSGGSSGSTPNCLLLIQDGTDAFDFGSVLSSTTAVRTGGWFNAATGGDYTAQSANVQDLTTAETLVEIVKIGAKAMARAGGAASPWQAIAGATVRNSATKSFVFQVLANRSGGTATATMTLRHVRAMRY